MSHYEVLEYECEHENHPGDALVFTEAQYDELRRRDDSRVWCGPCEVAQNLKDAVGRVLDENRRTESRIVQSVSGRDYSVRPQESMPTDPTERKTYPVASGVLDYFPDALTEIAHVSFVGNEQHNPGTPLHWDRSKSTDEADALIRHFLQRGVTDTDGLRHSAKMAWRALALLQKEIEAGR